jgi:hypothetical protein
MSPDSANSDTYRLMRLRSFIVAAVLCCASNALCQNPPQALTRIGTPEAEQAAAREQFKESVRRNVPAIVAFVATTAILALLVARGWGVLLGFLLPVLPPLSGVFFADSAWEWLTAIFAALICSLGGAVAGFLFASGQSGKKRTVGLVGGSVSVVAALVYGFLLLAVPYGFAPLGAG